MNTFHTARLRLTLWYTLISVFISFLFSTAIFFGITNEISGFAITRHVYENVYQGQLPAERSPLFDKQIVDVINNRLFIFLMIINGAILVIASGAGYFLAGRTLRPLKTMLDEQNRFITDASHELKTPLTALRSEFEAALIGQEHMSRTDAKALINSGLEEIIDIQGLTENLIELTQQQKRKGQLHSEEVSLLEIIEAALKKVIPLAKEKHITIQNDSNDLLFEGEKASLVQLCIILLDNAIKYSPNHATISITSTKKDNKIELAIIDKGSGITERELPHIFERFYRADTSRSNSAGYGLGLPIAKEIVSSHHGDIVVTSKPHKGTTVIVHLPLNQPA